MNNILSDPSRCMLTAGKLEAVFLPSHGMIGVSLRHDGVELLRRVDDLDGLAARGSSAGIPLLHPWANRLASLRYRALDRDVTLDPASPLVHVDENGLPIHGVPWPKLAWTPIHVAKDRLSARLDWDGADLLAVFPFPHRLEMSATLRTDSLTVETVLQAGQVSAVPVSFGFHPYFGLPNVPRDQWRLELPAMRRLVLDGRGIPTGAETPFEAVDGPLGDKVFDDGFATLSDGATFAISGGGRRICVEMVSGYRFAQIFAPKGKDFVALEPMTAPTNALVSGTGLQFAAPGSAYRAIFRVGVEEISV